MTRRKPLHRLRPLLAITLLVILAQNAFAQASLKQFNALLRQFREYHETLPSEKLFLHLDKSQYIQGETIWLKSYLVTGLGHLPSGLSKNVYVELLPAYGEPIETLILKSDEGFAHASIALDKKLAQGDYYLRAYTQWMKNQSSEYFFTKKIQIHSLDRSEILVTEGEYQPIELKFYPEGGHLVKNVASYMAFELTGSRVKDQNYSGAIYSNGGALVTTFTTRHEGRGKLDFVPKEKGYYAMIDGYDKKFTLPEIQPAGMVMLVNNKEDQYLNITVKGDGVGDETYHLVAHTRGFITFASEIQLQQGRTFTRINKSTLPGGITHITLLDKNLQPLAERLVFINQQEGLNVQITPDKSDYSSRERVTLDIKITDPLGKPVQGSFSLSVFDNIVENDQVLNNIQAHILLNSDIKGYIKNPGQYLLATPKAAEKLDLLLMVRGWSKFDWGELSTYKEKELFAMERGINLNGRLMTENLKSAKNARVLLMNTNNQSSPPLTYTDEAGRFEFQNQVFYDTTQLAFQGFHRKVSKNLIIHMDSTLEVLPFQAFDPTLLEKDPLSIDLLKQRMQISVFADSVWTRRNGFTDLGSVTIEARLEGKRNARMGGVVETTDFTSISWEEKEKKDLFAILMERVPGLIYAPITGPQSAGDLINQDPRFGFGERWVNGIDIYIDDFKADYIMVTNLQPTTIDYVLTSKGNPGVISIYTLDSKRYSELMPKPGLIIKNLPGYHVPDEFYSPTYDGKNPRRDLQDQRTTLFWAPMLTTDKNGEIQLTFYTPDQSTQVTIDLQGVSFNGKLGAGSQGFSIGVGQ